MNIWLIPALLLTFIPPTIYVIWIRNTEKYNKEKWKTIFICFLWGATIAIIASIILELILKTSISISINDKNTIGIISVVIIAPIVEELTKPIIIGMKIIKTELDELEDGFIYGAAAGLGFSATENFLYGVSIMSFGFLAFIILLIIRSSGACLLHASATAFSSYGYCQKKIKNKSILSVVPFFIFAIIIHSAYNFVLTFDQIGAFFGLIISLLIASLSIFYIRKKIIKLDRK